MKAKISAVEYNPGSETVTVMLHIPEANWRLFCAGKSDIVDVRNMQAVEDEQRVHMTMLGALRDASAWFHINHPASSVATIINQAIGAGRTLE